MIFFSSILLALFFFLSETPLQVEINTVSSSFGSLSSKINAFHQSFLHKNKDNKAFQALTTSYSITNSEILSDLSEDIEKNNSLEEIAYGLSLAHFYYLKKFEKTDEEKEKVLILVIVQENEKNVSKNFSFLFYIFYYFTLFYHSKLISVS